ncbi:MAG: hypothetical protein H7067_08135 [Burkholderiales bacterium]|nr:hypothetical protein [Opitutaceae bacterium]
MPDEQLTLFASLDFPGRTTITIAEMAEKLGVSCRHLEKEVDSAGLVALDIKGVKASKRSLRIPVECYRDYVLKRLTGPIDVRMRFLRDLPPATRRQLVKELNASLQ